MQIQFAAPHQGTNELVHAHGIAVRHCQADVVVPGQEVVAQLLVLVDHQAGHVPQLAQVDAVPAFGDVGAKFGGVQAHAPVGTQLVHQFGQDQGQVLQVLLRGRLHAPNEVAQLQINQPLGVFIQHRQLRAIAWIRSFQQHLAEIPAHAAGEPHRVCRAFFGQSGLEVPHLVLEAVAVPRHRPVALLEVPGLVPDDALQGPFQKSELLQQPRPGRGVLAHVQRSFLIAGLGAEEGIEPPEFGRLARRQEGDVGPDQIVVVVGEVPVDPVAQVTGEAVVEKLLVDRLCQFPGQFQIVALAQGHPREVLDHEPQVSQQMGFTGRPAQDFTGQAMDVFTDRFHLLAHPAVGTNGAQVGIGDDGRDQRSRLGRVHPDDQLQHPPDFFPLPDARVRQRVQDTGGRDQGAAPGLLLQIDQASLVDALGLGSHALVMIEREGRHQHAQALRLLR